MYSDRLNSSSNSFPKPSGSDSQRERDPQFAVVIARHVLTDTQQQRVILLDAARPSRIITRFCSYIHQFVFDGRIRRLKATSSANSIVCRRFVNTVKGYCEIFFVYKDATIQDSIDAMNKQLNHAAGPMIQEGIIFVPWPVPGPIPADDSSHYGPRGLLHQISQVTTTPTPASLFLSDENTVSTPAPTARTQNDSQRIPRTLHTGSVPPPRKSNQGGSTLPPPPSHLPPRPSWGPLSSQASASGSQDRSQPTARPPAQASTQVPSQSTSQIPLPPSSNASSQPKPPPRSAAVLSSTPRSITQTADRLRADFALIHAKNLINSQQLDVYKRGRYHQHRFWTYVGQFAPKFFEDFKGPKTLTSELNIRSKLIQVNSKTYREIFFVFSARESTQQTGSQSVMKELRELLLAARGDMRKMGKLLLSGPEDVSSQGHLYEPSLTVMNDVRAVPAVQILPHLLPASGTPSAGPSRAAPASNPSTSNLPAFASLTTRPLPHANNSSTQPSGSMPNASRNPQAVSTQASKTPAEIIELSDSDDDVVLLPSPPPAPARPPMSSPARPKRSLREEPIDVDAQEKEIIDLTDDSPARTTIALFGELPLSTEPSAPQTVPIQASPPSSAVSEEEPPPSSPEPEAMEVDMDMGVAFLSPNRTPPPNQDDDPLGPLEQTFSPIFRIQSPIRTPRASTTLTHALSPQRPSQQAQGIIEDGDGDNPLDILAAVRTLDRQESDTPDYMSDVDVGASNSNDSNRATLALQVNLDTDDPKSDPNTPLSAASSDVDAIDENVEDFAAACTEWAREMARNMEPPLAIRYLRKAAEHRKDPLDSSFSDRMRAQPVAYQLASYNRRIFESWIINSTMEEPEAPPIDVKNIVDEDPCPSWDFTYTNLLVRGDGVPKPPKASDLEGCNCVGGCRSDVDACSCAQRNMQFAEARNTTGFLYDSQGCLQEFAFPIFECNEACSCAEYCNNRVAQRGRKCRIDIRKTENRGWGVFASEDIPKGTYLGVYSGELLRDEEAEVRGKLYNEYNRTYLFDIDFWYIKLYMKKKRRKFRKGEYCVDAMHAGCFTRYFNHSCDPNSIIVPCVFGEAYPEIPYLAFFTIESIHKDQEITFSYQGGTITDERERNAARLRADAKRRLGKKKTVKDGTKTLGTIDTPCACGTVLCRGSMWNQESDEDEEDDELDGSDASDASDSA